MDMYATRTMLRALEQMYPPKSFLLNTFFPTVETSDTEYVDIDIIKGKQKLAPFVSPKRQGKFVEDSGYTTRTYKPPYIKMKKVFAGADIFKRQMGQHIYQGGANPAQRAAQKLGRDLSELREMIVRREEWMAAQALNSGTIVVKGDGIEDVLDFQMPKDHNITLTAEKLWTHEKSDPEQNLRHWKRKIARDSGLTANIAILGSDVTDALINNERVYKQLDNRRIVLGEIKPAELANGVTYIGNLGGVDLYGYDEWYLDDDGKEKPMVPVDAIFIASTQARTARHYGMIQDLTASASVPFFPKSWEEEDPSVRFIMVQSAPLVVPHQIDGFMRIKAV